MKMKLISFLLVFIMLCPIVPAMATFEDISGLDCEQDVNFLEALGIVEGFTNTQYAPDEVLSRAEMVAIVLRTMNIFASEYNGGTIFNDVSDDYWAYYEICTAYEMGLVSGVGDGMFAPDETVTFNQAVKMLVNVLGYGEIAEHKGGYPVGYLEIAERLDLDHGITLGGEKEITRGEMAILVANALNANVVEITEIGTYNDGYFQKISESGEILIKAYLNKERVEGRVNATYHKSIDGSLAPVENTVVIGNTVFAAGTSDIEQMLGEDVIAYVDMENKSGIYPNVLFVYSEADEVIMLNSVNSDYVGSKNKLVYTDEDGREKSISLSKTEMFVNGIEKLSVTSEDFVNADIKYISNSEEKIVIIDSYIDKAVKRADVENGIIYFNDSAKIAVNDYDRFYISDKNGKALDLSEIVRWNILSYYSASRNGEDIFIAVVADDAAVEGTVDTRRTSGGISEVIISDKVYTVSVTLDGTIPAVGRNIKFYTNRIGQIAYVADSNVDYKYGYITGIKQKTIMEDAQIRVFTDEGEFKIFTLSDKLKVNGNQVNVSNLENNRDFYSSGEFREQLIRYEGTGDVIKSITTCSDSIVAPSNRKDFGRNYYSDNAGSRWLGTFATKYTVDQDTLYFTVPLYDNPEDKSYKVKPISSLTNFTSDVGKAYFYDIDEDNVIGVILSVVDMNVGDAFDFKQGMTYGVVSEKETVYDEEMGVVNVLKIIGEKSAEKTIIINDEESPIRMTINANDGCSVITNESDPCYGDVNISYDNVDIGDIMGFKVNDSGVAYDAQMLVRRKYPKMYESLSVENSSEFYSETGYYEWASSTVKHISEIGIIADVNIYNGGPYERLFLKAPTVLEYDSHTDKVNVITWESIIKGERFSTCDWSIYPSIVLVYR